jgi:UDP-glucuronate 4-epimerase
VKADGPILVTGAAGFIGHAVCTRLLDRGEAVVGVDVFNAYYDPALKEARAATLTARPGFRMVRMDIAEAEAFAGLVRDSGARRVVHLAAQAGVRYDNPFAYERSNLAGHLSVLEARPARSMATVRWRAPFARTTRSSRRRPSMRRPSAPTN